MKKIRMLASILEVVIGVSLIICSRFGLVDDFWSGFGVSFAIIGALFLFRNVKYHTNKDYCEQIDVQNNDERNKYISMKAWSWSGYLFVIIAALGTIIFKLIGKEDLMMLCSGAVCLIVFLYYISYVILRKNISKKIPEFRGFFVVYLTAKNVCTIIISNNNEIHQIRRMKK